MPALALFSLATLLPVPLLIAAALLGGVWIVAALLYMTAVSYLLDQLVTIVTPPQPDTEFPAADGLCIALALGHFLTLALVVRALGVGNMGPLASLGLIMAAGLYFGQVSNANAHELIHRGARNLNRLGKWVYISLLYGHHTSAHVLIHHRLVATPDDPASARLGQGFYAYVPRAWIGAFRQGFRAETARLDRIGRSYWHHPYIIYSIGGLLMCIAAYALGGLHGLAGYFAIIAYAQMQLLLSDYVQHYGLTRKKTASDKWEAVGPRHSWNSPHWFSSALMLNAPRHADHHAQPNRSYPALRVLPDTPTLPRSLPSMATLALFPPLWRRVMDHRALRWQSA